MYATGNAIRAISHKKFGMGKEKEKFNHSYKEQDHTK